WVKSAAVPAKLHLQTFRPRGNAVLLAANRIERDASTVQLSGNVEIRLRPSASDRDVMGSSCGRSCLSPGYRRDRSARQCPRDPGKTKMSRARYMEFRLLAVFIWAFCLNPRPALAQPPAPSSNHPALTKFLQSHYKPSFDDARPPQYAFVDLNRDGVKEAIVYLRDRTWCGTGGCPTLILARRGSSY